MTTRGDIPVDRTDADHPSEQTFFRFLRRELHGDELRRFESHVRTCTACARRLFEEAQHEELMDRLRELPPIPTQVVPGGVGAWARRHAVQLIAAATMMGATLAVVLWPLDRSPEIAELTQESEQHRGTPGTTDTFAISDTVVVNATYATTPGSPNTLSISLVDTSHQTLATTTAQSDRGTATAELHLGEIQPPPPAGAYQLVVRSCPRDCALTSLIRWLRRSDGCTTAEHTIQIVQE